MRDSRRRAVALTVAVVNGLLGVGICVVPLVVLMGWVGDVGWNRQAAVGVAMLGSTTLVSAVVGWGFAVRAPRLGGEHAFSLAVVLNSWICVIAVFTVGSMWRDGRTDLLPFSLVLLVVVGANIAAFAKLWTTRGEERPAADP